MCAQQGKSSEAVVLLQRFRSSAFVTRNIAEVSLVTNMLVTLHLDSGDHVRATEAIQDTVNFLRATTKVESDVLVQLQCRSQLVVALVHQAQVSYLAGEPLRAIAQFEALALCVTTVSLKEEVLAWMAKSYQKVRNMEQCANSLKQLETHRRNHTTSASGPGRGGGGGGLSRTSSKRQRGRGRGEGSINLALSGSHLFDPKPRCLLRFSSKIGNVDLAEIRTKNLYHSGQYSEALKSLATAHACVETYVRRMKDQREPLIELGRLYYLRAKIQHAACQPSSGVVYPIHVTTVGNKASRRPRTPIPSLPSNQSRRGNGFGHTFLRFPASFKSDMPGPAEGQDPSVLEDACSPHASHRSFVGRPCVRVRACVRASRRNMQRNALQVGRKDGAAEALPRRMRRQCKEVGDRASGSLCHEGVRGGGPAPADRARRARRASARPLVVRTLPADAGPRNEKAARAGRRTGRTKRRQTPNEERRANAASNSNLQLLQTTAPKCEEDDVHVDATKFGSTRPPRVVRIKPESIGRVFAPPIGASSHRSNAGSFRSPRRSARSVTPL